MESKAVILSNGIVHEDSDEQFLTVKIVLKLPDNNYYPMITTCGPLRNQ